MESEKTTDIFVVGKIILSSSCVLAENIEAENSEFIELFKEKFREILGLELEAKEIKEQLEKKETAKPI